MTGIKLGLFISCLQFGFETEKPGSPYAVQRNTGEWCGSLNIPDSTSFHPGYAC